jgi:hypothetical protein
MKEGKLLGHIVSVEGVKIDPSRVEDIKTLSLPRSKKEIQSFLGKINFLRILISEFFIHFPPYHKHLPLYSDGYWACTYNSLNLTLSANRDIQSKACMWESMY